MKKYFLILALSFFGLITIFISQSWQFYDGKLHVVFCDVGQGDAIFIRTPSGADILVDGGPNDSVLGCLSRHMPFWDRDLELVFATHPDADHISGLEKVLQTYTVKAFYTSKKSSGTKVFARIQSLATSKRVPARFLFQGDEFLLSDGVKIKTFWPSSGYVLAQSQSTDTNSFSLVQFLAFGKFRALLTGDIESKILDNLFPSGLAVDIFKLPHHGSKTGVDDKTFSLINPKMSIISAGKNNRYHHPSQEVLSLLRKHNFSYKRTDIDGEIEVISDGSTFNTSDK